MANENLMIINHTEVDDSLKGKNVGYQLVNAAADFVRLNHLKKISLYALLPMRL